MAYDVLFVVGERFFDHPLCGPAILKRLLEKNGFSTGIIEAPQSEADIATLGAPRLFFGVSAGSIDSMLRNYSPLKKPRDEDPHYKDTVKVPDRASIVYANWIKARFREIPIVLGGVEATLRRFVHYDYWDNRLRRPILFDARADILAYGSAEKQVLEIARRLRDNEPLTGIRGTCVIAKDSPTDFTELPSFEEVSGDKARFCDMQNLLSNRQDLAQKIDNRYTLQYRAPDYAPRDLDEYYELPFTRAVPKDPAFQGFEFSVVTHRGCIGDCHFCSLRLTQGNRIVSRSEGSLLREITAITKMPCFKGNIDDIGGPSANMYGMDCHTCRDKRCLDCGKFDRTHQRLIALLRKARALPGVKKVFLRSGIRYDLAPEAYVRELLSHHILDSLRIAPEHVNPEVLRLMNKDRGDLNQFLHWFKKTRMPARLSFYYMSSHPGSSMKEAQELASAVGRLKNAENFQVFTPTPMTVSTCMYWTEMDPKTKQPVYVAKTFKEKKEQKRLLLRRL
ncbi:MAG: YgiQ family radical SAM protein [Fibrobacterota bacterium]